jgi:pimeloyl-ACP methyl ester carboxylesterase
MSTTEDRASGELREGYAEIGGVRLHYVEAGKGPLIVLLHGFPEFWYGWRQQIEPLAAAGFRVVAPDMRGYNLSSRPKGVQAYDTDQLTADIRGLIQERGATSALLAGPSAEAIAGTAPPRPAPQVLVLLLLRPPRAARKRRARRPLALLPALPA